MQVLAAERASFDDILTPEALAFLHPPARPVRRPPPRAPRRPDAAARARSTTDATCASCRDRAAIREDASWRVAGAGPGLEDRRVEITGPTDRKMTINALNSGAKVWLADQRGRHQPHLGATSSAGRSTCSTRSASRSTSPAPRARSTASTAEQTPTIVMRPRGWHLVEKHLRYIDPAGIASPASGSLVDFGLYFFHNAAGADRARQRPVLLPAQDREPPRGAALG